MRRLPPILGRRALPVSITLGLAAMAVALAQVGGAPPARAATTATSGSFGTANSREGAPIFAAIGIAPGGSTSGTVTIEDVGSAPIALELRRGELVDTLGLGGGVLSGRLQLTVLDITEPAAPRTIYSGPLDSMPNRPAGELEGGESRTFRFTATLPDGGSPSFQNAVQGAMTTVAYRWIAGEAHGEGGNGSGGGGGGSGATGGAPGDTGTNPPPSTGGGTTPSARALDLTVPKVRPALRGGRLVVWAACDVACHLTVRGRILATVAGAHRGTKVNFTRRGFRAPGPHRLRIPIPRGLRRWLQATPGNARLRARLRFLAVGPAGERDVARETVRLRVRQRR